MWTEFSEGAKIAIFESCACVAFVLYAQIVHGNEGTTKIYHKTRDIVLSLSSFWVSITFRKEESFFTARMHFRYSNGTFLSSFLFSPFGCNASHVFWISVYSILIDRSKRWAGLVVDYFAAYFILKGRDTHINFLQLLFMVGMICPLMQEHFLWPLLKSKALQCG